MDKNIWNFLQQGRKLLLQRPMGCTCASKTQVRLDNSLALSPCMFFESFPCDCCGRLLAFCALKPYIEHEPGLCSDCYRLVERMHKTTGHDPGLKAWESERLYE